LDFKTSDFETLDFKTSDFEIPDLKILDFEIQKFNLLRRRPADRLRGPGRRLAPQDTTAGRRKRRLAA
jgi:hypothetical protein